MPNKFSDLGSDERPSKTGGFWKGGESLSLGVSSLMTDNIDKGEQRIDFGRERKRERTGTGESPSERHNLLGEIICKRGGALRRGNQFVLDVLETSCLGAELRSNLPA